MSYGYTGVSRGEHGIDDAPRFLDVILAREERRVARHRVAEHALVGVHLVRRRVAAREQLDRLADALRPRSSITVTPIASVDRPG